MRRRRNREKESIFNANLVTALIFLIFLGLFPKYAPFSNSSYTADGSIISYLFMLYFFVANQALGIVHESGHGICHILHCPMFVGVANGTIFQVGFPFIVYWYYKKRNNDIGAYIALFFVGFSLYYTSWYISTANQGLFVPASKSFLGVDGYHDFNYILSHIGLLDSYLFISRVVKFLAFSIMLYSVYKMFLSNKDN